MKSFLIILTAIFALNASAQLSSQKANEANFNNRFRISLPGIILPQLANKSWDDKTHTQHIELHVKYELDAKNIIGVKIASWRLFQPMGILWWDDLLDRVESGTEFYPGHVRETGIGLSYQRMLWKGLFATAEVLPQFKTYLDENGSKIQNGFKLYNSFHIGYHFAFGKKKQFFVEPQVHSQFWVFDTNTPIEFQKLDNQWKNYFLFEPNIYLGVKF